MRSTIYMRTGLRALALGLWLVLMVSALLWLFQAEVRSLPGPPEVRTVVVQPGDTLWEIADKLAPDTADLRAVVSELVEFNGLASKVLQPGQVLAVPLDNT